MQKYTKNTSWFTLVELIIVITILSILATIGFTSFQWYTADARDTKRTSDLSSLISALEAKRAWNSLSLVSFVDNTTDSHVTWTVNIAGTGMTATGTDYSAWVMDFSLLWVAAASFQDPKWFNYSFGASRLKDWVYQFAAVLENGSIPKSVVKWNYSSRTATPIAVIPSARDKKVLEIQSSANYSKFDINDLLLAAGCWTTWTAQVLSISSDLKYLTLDRATTSTVSCNIQLWATETLWLIWDYSNTNGVNTSSPVVDGSGWVLAY